MQEIKYKNQVSFLISILMFCQLITSCNKVSSTNPFDLDCPKALFTPQNFNTVEYYKGFKLSWVIPNTNLTGHNVSKYDNNNQLINTFKLDREVNSLIDSAIELGRSYRYELYSIAGENMSNELNSYIKSNINLVSSSPQTISSNSAILGGSILSAPGVTINSVGVRLWRKSNSGLITATTSVTGSSFSLVVGSLLPNTEYFYQAFVRYNNTYAYGNELSFITL